MSERNTFEHKIGHQPERRKPAEVSEPENELEIELSPDELVEVTAEKMETEAESVVEKSKEEIKRLDTESGLGEPELAEAKKETGVEEETKSFGQKVSEVLNLAKDKIYGLFNKNKTEQKPEKEVVFDGVFDPEAELARIKKLPHEERKQAVEIYKEKLAAQKEGLAKMQVQVFEYLRDNKETTLEELNQKVAEWGSKYGMSGKQLEVAKNVLESYFKRHEAVQKIKKEYSNDTDLYKALFGRAPKGKVEIVEGPATLFVRCADLDDYTVIYSRAFLTGREIVAADKKAADFSGGISLEQTLIPGLEGAIIAEKSGKIGFEYKGWGNSKEIQAHEEQHAIKKFFAEQKHVSDALFDFVNSQTPAEKQEAIHQLCLEKRYNVYDKQAKDEIMAYFKGNEKLTKQDLLKILFKPAEKGGQYDYLSTGTMKKYIEASFSAEDKPELVPLVESAMKDVFVDKYKQTVEAGVQAFDDLRKSGMSTDETIALLTHEPLRKWPTVVKRILEQK